MGGCCCCCASNEEEPNSTSRFSQYPRGSEERQPLSHHGSALVLSTGQQPRTPPGNQDARKSDATAQVKNTETGEETNSGNRATLECDAKTVDNIDLSALSEVVVDELEKSGDLKKSNEPIVPSLVEEEDVCPTCLEEYDEENPKIITKCEHHFHLACIFEWMERSDTCPVCDQEMVFSA